MISAAELRIGNIHKTSESHFVNIGIHTNGYARISAYGIHLVEEGKLEFTPVPLTEEILLKCGFYKRDGGILNSEEYYKGFIDIYKVGGDHSKYQIGINGVAHIVFVEYLHQLQNLYFALTQTELEINL